MRKLLSTFVNALISAEPDAVCGARRYRGLDVLDRAVTPTKEVTKQPIIQALNPELSPHTTTAELVATETSKHF